MVRVSKYGFEKYRLGKNSFFGNQFMIHRPQIKQNFHNQFGNQPALQAWYVKTHACPCSLGLSSKN